MGFFANGLVFTTAPDFAAVHSVNPDRFARGYKHNQHPIWLVDFWKPRGTILRRQSPFCDPAVSGLRVDIAQLVAATQSFLATLRRLGDLLERGEPEPEMSYIHLALAAAGALRHDSFVFAADDNDLDMACGTRPGTIVSCGCRIDWLSISLQDGAVSVAPRDLFLPEHHDQFTEQLEMLGDIPGISILPAAEAGEGQTLFENPVGQWPKEAGDPGEILGLGTWDPLLNLDDDFTVVYERPAMK